MDKRWQGFKETASNVCRVGLAGIHRSSWAKGYAVSVYKHKNSPFYHYDFQMRGRRFFGSTGQRNRREADAVERGERERARDALGRESRCSDDITLDVAVGRYWSEVGRHHADAKGTFRDLKRLVDYFGKDKQLSKIRDDDVTKMVAWRRGHHLRGQAKNAAGKDMPLVSSSTVNRSTTQVLQKVFTRAKRSWGFHFKHEPNWRAHRLAEPQELVRELHPDEAGRIDQAMRPDYEPFFEFARCSGLRLNECLLRWSEVDWSNGQIRKAGKGGRTVVVPITPALRRILWPLRGHDSHWVFTYVAKRTRQGRVKGQRYPLTYNGVKTVWRRLRATAKVEGFRFHDFRHDLATKLLRETGNLKLVKQALNHADIKTTTRYAHVLTDEVAKALERVQESRKDSRTHRRRTG